MKYGNDGMRQQRCLKVVIMKSSMTAEAVPAEAVPAVPAMSAESAVSVSAAMSTMVVMDWFMMVMMTTTQ